MQTSSRMQRSKRSVLVTILQQKKLANLDLGYEDRKKRKDHLEPRATVRRPCSDLELLTCMFTERSHSLGLHFNRLDRLRLETMKNLIIILGQKMVRQVILGRHLYEVVRNVLGRRQQRTVRAWSTGAHDY
jgi:hypothetical protein